MTKHTENRINEHISHWEVRGQRTPEEAFALIEKRLEVAKVVRMRPASRWIFSAAVAVVLLLIGLFVWMNDSGEQVNNTTAAETIWLPDSSKVELAGRSKLKYRYNRLTRSRSLELRGEAFFSVRKGKSFVVGYPGGTVTVRGTQFGVVAYSGSYGQVNCVEGKVEVQTNLKSVVLTQGLGVRIQEGKLAGPFPVSGDEIIVRAKTGRYHWDSTPITDIFSLLSGKFGFEVKVPTSLSDRKFSGDLPMEKLDETLEILSVAMQFSYRFDESKMQLTLDAQ
jgi:ferric-dicitrate binding protein FerR (iron transport regulator)